MESTTLTTKPRQLTFDELQPDGSISHGTLRSCDLAAAFLRETDSLHIADEMQPDLRAAAEKLAAHSSETVAETAEGDDEIVSDLLDFLNDRAPDGWALQTLEGDGSDYCWQPVSLTAKLQAVGSEMADSKFNGAYNDALDDIIERFDDCPEALVDFEQSYWMDLCECYMYDLLNRWTQQERNIRTLFDNYCEAIGATSALEALEGQVVEDPNYFACAYVNMAMTWGARRLLYVVREVI